MSEATGHEYLESHAISGNLVVLDIEQESQGIMDAARAAGVGHAAKTLVKDGPLRLLILGFKAGSSLREHSADGPVTIHVLSGMVDVETSDGSQVLGAGKALLLARGVQHSVQASADSVLLLTIGWPVN